MLHSFNNALLPSKAHQFRLTRLKTSLVQLERVGETDPFVGIVVVNTLLGQKPRPDYPFTFVARDDHYRANGVSHSVRIVVSLELS